MQDKKSHEMLSCHSSKKIGERETKLNWYTSQPFKRTVLIDPDLWNEGQKDNWTYEQTNLQI